METVALNSDNPAYDDTPKFDGEGGGILVVLFIVVAMVLFAHHIGRMVSKETLQPFTLKCPPHKWDRTEPKPGARQVLRCSQCTFTAGPVDEWDRPTGNRDE